MAFPTFEAFPTIQPIGPICARATLTAPASLHNVPLHARAVHLLGLQGQSHVVVNLDERRLRRGAVLRLHHLEPLLRAAAASLDVAGLEVLARRREVGLRATVHRTRVAL